MRQAPGPGTGGRATAPATAPATASVTPPTSRYATMRASTPAPAPAVPAAGEMDDEPSKDDPTIEETGMVGPSVVAQLLGGRVIEERDE